MPALSIPFILSTNFTLKHDITHILLIMKKPDTLVTASSNGNLIIWNVNTLNNVLEPKFFLQPSLGNYIGALTCMTSIYIPIQYFTVKKINKAFFFSLKQKRFNIFWIKNISFCRIELRMLWSLCMKTTGLGCGTWGTVNALIFPHMGFSTQRARSWKLNA